MKIDAPLPKGDHPTPAEGVRSFALPFPPPNKDANAEEVCELCHCTPTSSDSDSMSASKSSDSVRGPFKLDANGGGTKVDVDVGLEASKPEAKSMVRQRFSELSRISRGESVFDTRREAEERPVYVSLTLLAGVHSFAFRVGW